MESKLVMPFENLRDDRRLCLALSLIVAIVFVAWNFSDLSAGTFRIRDEYTTLDRANAFHVRGDYSVVYSENIPSFRKPPLHYWISAALLDRGAPQNFAARFPSFLFGFGSILLTGLLAFLLLPGQPLVAPAAMALIAVNARFIASSKEAMLDTGTTFFGLAAMVGLMLALRNPRWWYVVAIACGLGGLQKAPVALAMVIIAIAVLLAGRRFGQFELKELKFGRHFVAAACLTFLIIFAWPLLQWIQFGFESIKEAYLVQMVQRFSPVSEDPDRSSAAWHHYILDRDAIFRLPAIAALFALPFLLKRRELLIFPLLLVLYALAAALAKGSIFPRYSLTFLPYLAASLAVVIFFFARYVWIGVLAVGIFCLQNFLLLQPSYKDPKHDAAMIAMLEKFKTKKDDGRTIILCDWRPDKIQRIPPGMFSLHASGGRAFYAVPSPAAFAGLYSSGAFGQRLQGLCTPAQLKAIEPALKSIDKIEDLGSHINWTAG